MRRLIMWNLVTLDGFFEGEKPWDLDFHMYVWGDELERLSLDQLDEADLLVFGRRTYEGMAAYWIPETGAIAERMNSIGKLVFSHTLERADWNNTRLVGTDPAEEIRRLKALPGKDMFVFGSADLSATLMRENVFDEYRLCLVPVVRGGGNPLFKEAAEQLPMELLEARPLQTGGVILRYRPKARE
ncbi:MAG TPA: dihydrofolate reductase family protein [Longimicrobiales bacterium]